MNTPSSPPNATLLDHLRYTADPLADDTVSRIVGTWQALPDSPHLQAPLDANALPWQRIAMVSQIFGKWQNNQSLRDWRADPSTTPPDIAAELEQFVRTAQVLPSWGDARQIERAEQIFLEHGVLSCTLLFCSSLPECYVIPDLSSVLQATGQLDKHTDYRIRATAAMVFPVMMTGGLMGPQGNGIAQILKVRLIHATVRNLLLRGNPAHALHTHSSSHGHTDQGTVPPLASSQASTSMQATLFALGWDVNKKGLPCNQEELAYTLLTFGYVFLRSLRRLGIGLPSADEEAYLHAWNVVGHVLGLQTDLRVNRMADAEILFAQLQAKGNREPVSPDPRPALTKALMRTMQQVLPLRVLKPFPILLTRYLCGRVTSRYLGLTSRISWLPQLLFATCLLTAMGIDRVVRLLFPRFSISRLITRWLGAHFMAELLLSQTRELQLPGPLRNQVQSVMAAGRNKK